MTCDDLFLNHRRGTAGRKKAAEAGVYKPEKEEKAGNGAKNNTNNCTRLETGIFGSIVRRYQRCGGYSVSCRAGCGCYRRHLSAEE